MRKLIALLLTIILAVSLVACSNQNPASSTPESNTPTISHTQENTEPDASVSENTQTSTSTNSQTPSTNTQTSTDINNQTSSTNTQTPNSNNTTSNTTSNTTTPHSHSFSAATCTQPKTCTCGATQGTKLEHIWTDATCQSPKTCTLCKTTTGEKLNHNFVNYVCSKCGTEDTEGKKTNPKYALKETPYSLYTLVDGQTLQVIAFTFDFQEKLCLYSHTDYSPQYDPSFDSPDWDLPFPKTVTYNGVIHYYHGGLGGGYEFELTDTTIILKDSYNGDYAEFVCEKDGSIKLISGNYFMCAINTKFYHQ